MQQFYMIYKMMIMKIFVLLTIFISCQGQRTWEEEYPFIKNASTFSSADQSKEYDYIVIGGGTAGCPLAATLSQKYNVLLLERGDVPFDNRNVSLLRNFHINNVDTSATSPSQFFQVEGIFHVRPRILGGATSINAGFYTRPSLRSLREVGLDRDLAYESYPWIEKQIIYKPALNVYQRAVGDALLKVGVTPNNGYTFEHLNGTKYSGTMYDKEGIRHSAAELLQSANPINLDVLIHAQAQKIVFDQSSGKPRAVGVIFDDENGEQHRVYLSKNSNSEIILSAGAIGSPQLLLLSGIGPKEELAQMNIDVVLDNEHVGKQVADNPLHIFVVPFNRPVNQSLIQTVGITGEGVYIEAESGFGQAPTTIHYTHDEDTTPEEMDQELPHEAYNKGVILSKIADPLSTGELTLNNTNAADNPNISFNYFSNPKDLETCVRGIRIIEKLVKTTYLKNFMPPGNDTFERLLSISVEDNFNGRTKTAEATESLEQFCIQAQVTIGHYHGGCHKGKVIDNEYKVLNVDGLRVVDGSTFVQSPGANPQATVLMMGRYMGVKILRSRQGTAAGEYIGSVDELLKYI